jgi:hypothetical protein
MKNDTYYVVTFDSTHHAIKAERVLNEKGISIKTIPTPREITASCGLSIRFDVKMLDEVKKVVERDNLAAKGIYKIVKNVYGRKAEHIL